MHPILAIISSALLLLLTLPTQGQPVESNFLYTLQVASFPDAAQAEQYAERLTRAGQPVGFGTVEVAGLGRWTRVYVGTFKTAAAARYYGDEMLRQKLIAEYVVKTVRELQSLGRPRTTNRKSVASAAPAPQAANGNAAPAAATRTAAPRQATSSAVTVSLNKPANSTKPPATLIAPQHAVNVRANRLLHRDSGMSGQLAALLVPLHETLVTLPLANDVELHFAPALDAEAIPRPDPVYLAFNLISENHSGRGGLWVSGDCADALARLRYIVGERPDLIYLGDNGAVRINRRLLAEAAGANEVAAEEAPVRIAEYITGNEGLLLLVQLIQGTHRYLLHIARRAPTLNGIIDVVGGINLDNNYDSRINPYRRNGRKLEIERPPKGFDSLVAINPAAHWFNLRVNEFVTPGQITFHELAEAHAKVALSLDYLEQGSHPGAHEMALTREQRLQAQRPTANLVLTLGSNRLFRSEEELRNFNPPPGQAAGHQR
jgi:SPOR domain